MSAEGMADQQQRDVGQRWTPGLARGGWTPIANLFLDHYSKLDVTNIQALFIIHVLRFKWGEGAPFPSYEAIARRMGITPTAARAHARALEKKGLLVRVRRGNQTNMYDFTPLFRNLHRVSGVPWEVNGDAQDPTSMPSRLAADGRDEVMSREDAAHRPRETLSFSGAMVRDDADLVIGGEE